MEIDEVLYSYLMAGSSMILPPIGSSVHSDPNFGSFSLGGSAGTQLDRGDADSALLGAQLELEFTDSQVKRKKPVDKRGVRARNLAESRLSVAVHCPVPTHSDAAFSYTGHCLNFPKKIFPQVCWLSTTRASRCRI